ncbi:PREDICTED: DNA topoisomerase 3-alpha-like [Priapulus caudatus]|uniref:DNA topoisomerase n=1 Tax=Priapulus caudatus TaxID=37621 RepID=A0ABM1EDM5_PRICU|nr:PREDICTED: DNA topoisomerase 3-alpha-like [Priapulus caudatus]
MRRRDGFSRFNKIYEFQYDILGQHNINMVMTSVSGHLLNHEFTGEYRRWTGCPPVALFDAPLHKSCPQNYVDIKRTLEREVRGCQSLIIWTDCDREGENIGCEVVDVCLAVRPNLRVYRARFSEITAQSVASAARDLVAPDRLASAAVDVRSELDLRIGAAFTRLQTLRLQRVFPHVLADQLISYGSCQFPTLGFVVERYKQVQAFVPEPFWKIAVRHDNDDNDGRVEFVWKRVRLFDHRACLVLYQICMEDPTAEVVDIQSKNKSKWRPLPLDTVLHGTYLYSNGLQGNEKRIYEFIVRHFLACVSQDAQGHETKVEIDIAAERFVGSGLMVIARNYLEVYPYDRWNAKYMPVFEVGQRFQPTSVEMVDGETTAPPLLTEADLIALMERHGIGTDATHADHIETIKSRAYVGVRDDGRFVPGELGMGLVDGYDSMGLAMSKPRLRAELEADLRAICDGSRRADDVLATHVRRYRDVFVAAARQAGNIDTALSAYFGAAQPYEAAAAAEVKPVCACPKCGSSLAVRSKKDGAGLFIGCMGFPECRNATWLPAGVLAAEVTDAACDACAPTPVRRIRFKFRAGAMPAGVPLDYEGCLGGCDPALLEALGVQALTRPGGGAAQQPAARQTRPSPHGRNDSGYDSSTHASRVDSQASGGATARARAGPTPQPHREGNPRGSGVGGGGDRLGAATSRGAVGKWGAPAGSPGARSPLAPIAVGNNNAVVCGCGNDAALRTVVKEGPNRGRAFYVCSRAGPQPCDFFMWGDDGPPAPRSGDFGGADNATANCRCGVAASKRTVQKDGPNRGRQFYVCSKPQEAQCGFFEWADAAGAGQSQPPGGAGQSSKTSSGYNSGSMSMNTDPGDSEVKCNCGAPAPVRTVQKEGPNRGRQFYCCSKPRESQCGFFQWADDGRGPGITPGPSPSSNYNAPPGGAGAAGGRVKAVRKCGICGVPGHNRTKCPQR